MSTTSTVRGCAGFLSLIIAAGVCAAPADAAPISAYEFISDSQPFDAFVRDLTRERWSSVQGSAIATDDVAIAAQNAIDSDFGLANTSRVTYTHSLAWLNPPAGSYGVAQLTIMGWGNLGGNDRVIVDTIDLGAMNNGSLGSLLFSSTMFDVLAQIVDGTLTVDVRKNVGGNFLAGLNAFSVYGSRLDVRYEPVPEPATIGLFGVALALYAHRLRRRTRPLRG